MESSFLAAPEGWRVPYSQATTAARLTPRYDAKTAWLALRVERMCAICFGFSTVGGEMRCVRNVFFSFSALSPSLAAVTKVAPLNASVPARAERMANLCRDAAEFVFFGFTEVRFFRFRIERHEDDYLNI
jgi:hypothetical protein